MSVGTYGSCNDKTLIRFDDFIRELRESPLYTTEIEYALKVKVRPTKLRSPVFICFDPHFFHTPYRWTHLGPRR